MGDCSVAQLQHLVDASDEFSILVDDFVLLQDLRLGGKRVLDLKQVFVCEILVLWVYLARLELFEYILGSQELTQDV